LATKQNTRIEIATETHTRSEAKTSYIEWFRQKRRHFTTGGRYRLIHKILLGGEIASRVLFYVSFAVLLAFKCCTIIVLSAFALRFIIQNVIFYFASRKLNERDLIYVGFLYDIFLPVFNISVAISNLISPQKTKWK